MSWRGAMPDRRSSATTPTGDDCGRPGAHGHPLRMGVALLRPHGQPSPPPAPDAPAQPRRGDAGLPLRIRHLGGAAALRTGHLFQGRYRAEMIEDESYYWTVSRYIHLNPVRAGLVARPEQWEWSSYPGYRDPRRRQPWVAHDALLAAWRGDHGGKDAAAAYVRFVEAGLTAPPCIAVPRGVWRLDPGLGTVPRRTAHAVRSRWCPTLRFPRHGNSSASTPSGSSPPWPTSMAWRRRRCRAAMTPIWHDRSPPGSAAAIPKPPLRLLAERLGLSRADSVPNLTRRLESRLKTSPQFAEDLDAILQRVRAGTTGLLPTATNAKGAKAKSPQGKTKNQA